ncbi:response regulator transcription factor [Proteus vulgaris]|uniref:response regulator transcription factor n=1 Tax=Gammaproteobacteria TaxID=1236 RepID=UPI00065E6EE9|nr:MULTISPECIES: response regulator transcription factor [Gammaproteobacteria]MBG5984939.1 response regulator transcription factor [Proteus vulgaris]
MKKILLVEDNREIVGIIYDYFEGESLVIDYADNGELGLELALESVFDVIILDLMLPRMNGLTVCEKLRDAGNTTPVLMLTALDNRDDMLSGFKHGADDYLTKPFDLEILEARLGALIKRNKGTVADTSLEYGSLHIDQKTHLAYRNGVMLTLNPTTYSMLELLCKRAPNVVTREEFIQLLWQDEAPDSDLLRSHIYKLRSQLDKPFESPMLITVPKVGYRLGNVT